MNFSNDRIIKKVGIRALESVLLVRILAFNVGAKQLVAYINQNKISVLLGQKLPTKVNKTYRCLLLKI